MNPNLSETLPHVKAKLSRIRHRRAKAKMRTALDQDVDVRVSNKEKAVKEQISRMRLTANKRMRNSLVARAAKRKLLQLNCNLVISELRKLCQYLVEFRQSQMLENSYDQNIQTISDQCVIKKDEILVQMRALKQVYRWCSSDHEHRGNHLRTVDVSDGACQETPSCTNSIPSVWKLFKSPNGFSFKPEAYQPGPPCNASWSKYFKEN